MTIAQELKITEFPFKIKNSNGKLIYHETSDGYWGKSEYDANGNESRYETSDGFWYKREYDANGNQISYETSKGYWDKWEYDAKGSLVYWESKLGIRVDERPETVELTLDEIAKKLGIDVRKLKIKK